MSSSQEGEPPLPGLGGFPLKRIFNPEELTDKIIALEKEQDQQRLLLEHLAAKLRTSSDGSEIEEEEDVGTNIAVTRILNHLS